MKGNPVAKELLEEMLLARSFGESSFNEDWRSRALEGMEHQFRNKPNAVMPWQAIRLAAKWRLPTPQWPIEYFADRAEKLVDIVCDKETAGSKEAETIGKMLGFGAAGRGQTSAGQSARLENRDFLIAVHVVFEMEVNKEQKHVESIDHAKWLAANYFGVSPPAARRAFDDYEDEARLLVSKVMEQLRLLSLLGHNGPP